MNNGGQAFPNPASEFTKNGTCPDGNISHDQRQGMSLREWFAGMAMQALLIRGYVGDEPNAKETSAYAEEDCQDGTDLSVLATDAFRAADKMLAERNKS